MTNDLTKMGNEEIRKGFEITIHTHTDWALERIKTPEHLQHIIGAALDSEAADLQEGVDYSLEVRRLYSNGPLADSDGWVSVETGERPEIIKRWGGPKDDMYGTSALLLICSEGIQHTGYYYESGTWSAYWGEILRNVTHYRPLPQPPKKAGKP